jgi:hypothetical protein
LLLSCYYAARVTKITGNKPGEKTSSETPKRLSHASKKNQDLNQKEPVRLRQMRIINGGSLYRKFDDIWLEGFRAYLLEVDTRSGRPSLSSSTALSYFNSVRTALTTAYERRIIERNPAKLARPIRAENAMREFLTLSEVETIRRNKM